MTLLRKTGVMRNNTCVLFIILLNVILFMLYFLLRQTDNVKKKTFNVQKPIVLMLTDSVNVMEI